MRSTALTHSSICPVIEDQRLGLAGRGNEVADLRVIRPHLKGFRVQFDCSTSSHRRSLLEAADRRVIRNGGTTYAPAVSAAYTTAWGEELPRHGNRHRHQPVALRVAADDGQRRHYIDTDTVTLTY